jgi:hypothetical protein
MHTESLCGLLFHTNEEEHKVSLLYVIFISSGYLFKDI